LTPRYGSISCEVERCRATLLHAGLSVSTSDAHVAQCAIDCEGLLWSLDKIFGSIAKHTELRLFSGRASR
jgi:hypothetical protein